MPKQMKKLKSEILTVMLTDLSRYTEISETLDREEFNDMHNVLDSLCLPTFKVFEGELIKKIGDAFLVTFKSPTNALNCAVELQKKFLEYNLKEHPKNKLKIKVAIHSGEVLLRGNDVFGEVVNLVSRISQNMPPNQIYLTKAVYLSVNGSKLSFSSIGYKKFKGIKKPVHLSKINWYKKHNKSYKKFDLKIIQQILIFLAGMLISFLIFILLNKL